MIDPGTLHDDIGRVPGLDLHIDGDFKAGDRAIPELMIAFGGSRNCAAVGAQNLSDIPLEARHQAATRTLVSAASTPARPSGGVFHLQHERP